MGKKKCEHGRQRSKCKDCGSSGICVLALLRARAGAGHNCKDCGGSGICEHGRQRSRCKDCGGGGHVTFVEATEVDEFDGEEDPDECTGTITLGCRAASW